MFSVCEPILVHMPIKTKKFFITTETCETIRIIAGDDHDLEKICPVCLARLRMVSEEELRSEPHIPEIDSLVQRKEK